MCQGIMQHRRELMQIFIGFRARHRKLPPKDIKGRICLAVIEDEQQFVGHRRQFAFATTAWFAPAPSGLNPFFIRFLLRCLVDVAEDRQQVVELGLGQAGQGFHLTLVSDLHAHWLASSMAFWRTVYLSLYWGTTLLFAGNPLLATMDAFRMIEAPSGSNGSAFCTVNRRPFTLMSKIESKRFSVIEPSAAYSATPAFANTMSRLPFSRVI